jgi:Raf kinase inhibitor-like YbhB/YbcL family protein
MRRTLLVAFLVVACSPADDAALTTSTFTTQPEPTNTVPSTTTTTIPPTTTTTEVAEFGMTSPSFADGEPIPRIHTCDGADLSPGLSVVGVPDGTESMVLIVDDPDAPLGTWDHWVEFNLTPSDGSLEIPSASGSLAVPAANSWKLTGYKGPCPPDGEAHEYSFTVYALDTTLDLPPGVESDPVYSAMEGHVIDSVSLTGTYAR